MKEFGIKSQVSDLRTMGIEAKEVFWNLTPTELIEKTILNGEGVLSDTGALAVDTGEFTGRSPKDKFFVLDDKTKDSIWWGDFNHSIDLKYFSQLKTKMTQFVTDKTLYVKDVYACADPQYKMKVRVISDIAFHNLFAYNMFINPETEQELLDFVPEYTVFCLPNYEADPSVDGVLSKNFAILNMTDQFVIIGGTGYTGEIKKGIFTVLNFILPFEKQVLAMHCSANVGKNGDTAVFFGLSGTGKTTLSADPDRFLIGDDEHGWSDNAVFNFEGGCYAKTINLSRENEPEIWDAIKFGALLENIRFFPNTRTVDFEDVSVTENTRVSYPLKFIPNSLHPATGGVPKNIFFLTCDAFGVLPPISKLTPGEAMFHFISGYTAKVAGTEMGITEPKMTFSTCFGAPFMPLHPTKYATLLGEKMQKNNVNVWMINTGWSGGAYGEGKRVKLKFTRAMITAALDGKLDTVKFHNHPVFGVAIPETCPEVPTEILDPKLTWTNKEAYDEKANFLAKAFVHNFEKFKEFATTEILAGMPKV
jgi:phosphoenolpyruvate carboxykinase (ATP)